MAILQGLGGPGESAGPQLRDRAYFLDLLGDSHHGLGRYDAAVEAYRQAAQRFQAQDAPDHGCPTRPFEALSPAPPGQGRFEVCPALTEDRAG